MMSYWQRFITPYSTRWVQYGSQFSFVTYKKIYIFGIRVAVIQTSDPSP